MDRYTPLPKKGEKVYTKIKDLTDDQHYNILCKVTGIYNWTQSKGEDLVMTLKVRDDTSDSDIFIKIFSPVRLFNHGFFKDDILRVHNIKLYRLNFYLISKESDIEVVYSKERGINMLDKDILDSFFIEKSSPVKDLVDQDKLNNYLENKDLHDSKDTKQLQDLKYTKDFSFVSKEIKDLRYSEYIKFSGILINKQKESDTLYILAFIDYTSNQNIEKSENRGFYENNMVIYVRAWDKIAVQASNMKENAVYCLENLKIKIHINKIMGDLSDTPLTKITEITDKSIISSIKDRQNIVKDRVITFSEHIYNSNIMKEVNLISEVGYYKIRVKILRHYPYKGASLKICKVCNIVDDESVFKCECGGLPDNIFLVKYLVRDESGENVLICKNNVAKTMLQRCDGDKIFELLVYAEIVSGRIYLEVKDVPNFIN
jgi:hypothetical protein